MTRDSSETSGSELSDRLSRRRYIQAAAAGGALTLAGCSGNGESNGNGNGNGGSDGNGDSDGNGGSGGGATELVVSMHQQGTNAFAQGQATAAVVNDATDEIRLDVRPSGSVRENIGRFARGETDLAFVGNWELANLEAGNEPYADIGVSLDQVVTYNYSTWMLITNDESVQTIGDLDGRSIGAGPEGAAVNQITRRICDMYGVDADFPDVAFGDKQGAFSEGIIDAAAITLTNFEVIVPWVEQIMASEDTYVVEWPDGGDMIVEDELISSVTWEQEQIPDFDRVPDGDHIGWDIGFFLASTTEVSDSSISTMLSTMNNNLDALIEANSAFSFHENMDYWTRAFYDGGDIHPGAQSFYEDQGLL